MIFECGPEGADLQVCQELTRRLNPAIVVSPATLDNKPKLIRDCGKAAARLFSEGCKRVLIIWDLYPAWREKGVKPCRREDREAIQASLKEAGISPAKVGLICIQEELEAWLLADGRALSEVLSTAAHPVRVRDSKDPKRIGNPKKVLRRLFTQHTGRPYSEQRHPFQIAQTLPDLNRLSRLATFARFSEKLRGN